jgi:hypothetical protein
LLRYFTPLQITRSGYFATPYRAVDKNFTGVYVFTTERLILVLDPKTNSKDKTWRWLGPFMGPSQPEDKTTLYLPIELTTNTETKTNSR